MSNTAPGLSPSNFGHRNATPRFHHFNWLYFDTLGPITCTSRLKTEPIRCPFYKLWRVIRDKFFQWRWFIVYLCCVSVSNVHYFLENGRVAALFTLLPLNWFLGSLLFTEFRPHAFNLIIFFENIIEIIHIDRVSSLGISAELRYIQFTILHLDAWSHIVFFLLFLFGNRNLHLGQKSAILLTFNIVLYLWIEVFKSDVINLNVHTFRFTSALKSTVICFFRLEIWLNLTQTIGEYLFIHPDQQFLVLQKHLK